MDEIAELINMLHDSKETFFSDRTKKLLLLLCCCENEKNLEQMIKSFDCFSRVNQNLTVSHCDSIFYVFSETKFINLSNKYIIAMILAQIAAFDFPYFVGYLENLIVKMEQSSQNGNNKYQNIHMVFSELAGIILNPLSGFLLNAAKTKNNSLGLETKEKFDFFSQDSPDLKSKFGEALLKFRSDIIRLILLSKNEIKQENSYDESALFVPSIQTPYRNSLMASYPNEIGVGFPYKFEILYLASEFLKMNKYTKSKKYKFTNPEIINPWNKYYEIITGFEPTDPYDFLPINHFSENDMPEFSSTNQYLKVIPFLQLKLKDLQDLIGSEDNIISIIIGKDYYNASFYICLCQVLLLTDPQSFGTKLFDSIIKAFSIDHLLTYCQYYSIAHSIARFLDVLCIHRNCFISTEQIYKLSSIALVGFCCMHQEIRDISFKLIKSIGRLNPKCSSIYDFIYKYRDTFDKEVLPIFERNPISLIAQITTKPKVPLKLAMAIRSPSPVLWQVFLLAFGKVFSLHPDPPSISSFKAIAIKIISIPFDFYLNNELDPDIEHNIRFLVNILMLLLSLTTIDDPNNTIIFQLSLNIAKKLQTKHVDMLLLMMQAIPSEKFDNILLLINNENDPFVEVLFLRAISWSPMFFSKAKDENFLKQFIEIFLRTTIKLSDDGKLFYTFTTTLNNKQLSIISENVIILTIFSSVCYQLFSLIHERHNTIQNSECFPCKISSDPSNNPEILHLSLLYAPLLNMSLFVPKSYIHFADRLRFYSIRALAHFLACSKPNNISFLFEDISTQFYSIIEFCPSILHYLLERNFKEVFPYILKKSLHQMHGTVYFKAMYNFFRPEAIDLDLDDVLKKQWSDLSPITRKSELLQTIYENSGIFVFTCMLYIVKSDSIIKNEAFILLASICPILLLFEDGGRTENVHEFIEEIVQICNKYGRSFTAAEHETLSVLGRILCTKFAYCTEQLLKTAFDTLPSFSIETINEVLSALLPWFASIDFDFEDRVVSKDTDLAFICFTCYSFVDSLVNAFHSTTDFNSPIFSIWRALVMDDDTPSDNFLPVMLCLFSLGENNPESAFLISLIQYLSTLNHLLVLSIVTSQISFSDYFQLHNRRRNHSFVLNCLKILCCNSVQSATPFLYLIFAFSVVFKEVYPKKIIGLLHNVINSLKLFIQSSSMEYFERLRNSISINDVEPDLIYPFLNSFDIAQAYAYRMELLRWGLCCGDIVRASTALNAKPAIPDTTVIGLIARAVSNISLAATITSDEILPTYVNYIDSALKCLTEILKEMEKPICDSNKPNELNHPYNLPNTAIFWAAIECLKCPDQKIYKNALLLFDHYLKKPYIFSAVNGDQDEVDTQMFTKKSLWEFHIPWNEKYEGCVESLYMNAGYDFSLTAQVILHLINIKFTPLMDTKSCCYETAILALLPWFWMSASLSLKRYSRYGNEIIETLQTLKTISISDSYADDFLHILDKLLAVFQLNDTKPLRRIMLNIASKLIDMIDNKIHLDDNAQSNDDENDFNNPNTKKTIQEEKNDFFKWISSFYTAALEYRPKKLKVPLVLISSIIIQKYPEFKNYLKKFLGILSKNNSDNNDDVSSFISEFNNSNEITNDEDDKEISHSTFPSLSLFDRIVVVIVPHLYESNLADQINEEFNDLNSFPPLFPINDDNILKNDKFRNLEEHITQIEVVPFADWEQILQKMQFELIDSGFVPRKLVTTTPKIDVQSILLAELESAIQTNAKQKSDPNREMEVIAPEITENEEVQCEDEDLQEIPDPSNDLYLPNPYDFVVLGSSYFLPSLDFANSVGDELFDDMNDPDVDDI